MHRIFHSFLFLCAIPLLAWSPLVTVPEKSEGQGAFLGNFVAVDGEQLPEAATRVWVSRTAEALRFHIECQEPLMPQTFANVTAHDGAVWNDDCVEVFLQPTGWKEYAHFIVNSLGTKYDEMGRGGRDWNPEWTARAERKVYDWNVDIEIPYASLDATPAEGDVWKFNVCRCRKAVPELSSWSPSPSRSFHDQAAFGSMAFIITSYPINIQKDNSNFIWELRAGASTPEGIETETIPLASGNVAQHFDYHEDGQVIYSALRLIRTSQVANILSPVKEFLDTSTSAELLRQERAALLALSEDATPEACAILERNARDLLKRVEHLRSMEEFARQGHQAAELLYGVETSLVKVMPGELFGGVIGGEIHLDAARREMDAAQVVLFAGDSPLIQAEAAFAEPLKREDGAELPLKALRIRRVALVKTCQPDYPAPLKGNIPDPLVPATPFDVAANGFETLWVDVRVPADAQPGVYRGSLVLKARNTDATTVPVELRVRNFTIPERSSIVSAFGTRFNPGRFNYDREAYLENYLEHRITPYFYARNPKFVRKPAMDWSNAEALAVRWQSDFSAGVLVKITMLDGKVHNLATPVETAKELHEASLLLPPEARGAVSTVTAMLPGTVSGKLAVELLKNGEKVALIPETEVFAKVSGDWVDQWPGVTLEAWAQPDLPAEVDWTEFDADMEYAFAKGITSHWLPVHAFRDKSLAASLLSPHLAEKGWTKYFYTYLYDEPEPKDYPVVNQGLGDIKRVEPHDLQNMMTARAFPDELRFVDIWCPELYTYNPETSAKQQRLNRAVWWYVAFSTRHPYPNVWVDYPALDCRVWPWMSWKHDLDGMLYWSAVYWDREDPWRTAELFPHANGDGSLLYPDKSGAPIDSLRWECLRDGMEDYEVFCLLEAALRELGDREPELSAKIQSLLAISPEVLVSYKQYNPDPKALLAARREMSDTLEQAVAVLGHEPVIEGRPRYRTGRSSQEVVEGLSSEAKEQMMLAQAASDKLRQRMENQSLSPLVVEDGLKLLYDFDEDLPYVRDCSGNHLDTTGVGIIRIADGEGYSKRGIRIGKKPLKLPGGSDILGTQPAAGTIAFWVKPEFDPKDYQSREQNLCLFYLMETDGNGLPDGYDEIGIYLTAGRLCLRLGGYSPQTVFAGSAESPFRKGEWTHVAVTWQPGERTLYIDGKPVLENHNEFLPPKLDAFPGNLGNHPPTERFAAPGIYDDLFIFDRALSAVEIQQFLQ
ncbi:MAG: DUF4091 domain-containing protein [Victivallales bacterium]|nr:DUF4091 domain-containing protein [Victivallales bacterium]